MPLRRQFQNSSVVKLDAGNTLVEPRVAHSVMPVVPADSKVWQGEPVLIDVLVQIDAEGRVVERGAAQPQDSGGHAARESWRSTPRSSGPSSQPTSAAKKCPAKCFCAFSSEARI